MRLVILLALVGMGCQQAIMNPGQTQDPNPNLPPTTESPLIMPDGGSTDALPIATSPEFYKSGSRIKALVLSSDDGAMQFRGWQDTSINAPCTFLPTNDGKNRCVVGETASTSINYSDNSCTQLLHVSTNPTTNAYAYNLSGGLVTKVYSIDSLYIGSVYVLNGSCNLISSSSLYFYNTTDIPLNILVAAKVVVQ